jgi:hypothetical protein
MARTYGKIIETVTSGYAWTNLNPTVLEIQDGQFGFYLDGVHRIVGGWIDTTQTKNTQFHSANASTWVKDANAPWTPRHTFATFIEPTCVRIVGGDVFSPVNDGDFAKDSWIFQSGTWTRLAVDCGIGNRCLMGAVYNPIEDSHYLIGGQSSVDGIGNTFQSVLKSTDHCVSFTEIASTGLPFIGGNYWGTCAWFNGYIYKITGGIYQQTGANRRHEAWFYRSSDGITWEKIGVFMGGGRLYPQVIVWDNKLWIICGHNFCYFNGGYNIGYRWETSSGNTSSVYFTEDGLYFKELITTPQITPRHAHSCYVGPDGLYSVNGSNEVGTTNGCWKLTKT